MNKWYRVVINTESQRTFNVDVVSHDRAAAEKQAVQRMFYVPYKCTVSGASTFDGPWYAVQENPDDAWDVGSCSFDEACRMLEKQGAGRILVIKDGVTVQDVPFDEIELWHECDICHELSRAGYVLSERTPYDFICDVTCLGTVYDEDEYDQLYEDGEAYWTMWQ